VLEQLGVDPLHPLGRLIEQALVQPSPLSPLEDRGRRDPAFGQFPPSQQFALQPGIAAVGLGPLLATSPGLRLGRFGQMRDKPRGGDLFDHVAPARAPFHRDVDRSPRARGASSSLNQRRNRSRSGDQTRPRHASPVSGQERVEGDLPSVQIQPTYHRHQDLLVAALDWTDPIVVEGVLVAIDVAGSGSSGQGSKPAGLPTTDARCDRCLTPTMPKLPQLQHCANREGRHGEPPLGPVHHRTRPQFALPCCTPRAIELVHQAPTRAPPHMRCSGAWMKRQTQRISAVMTRLTYPPP